MTRAVASPLAPDPTWFAERVPGNPGQSLRAVDDVAHSTSASPGPRSRTFFNAVVLLARVSHCRLRPSWASDHRKMAPRNPRSTTVNESAGTSGTISQASPISPTAKGPKRAARSTCERSTINAAKRTSG
jgi:hypothetical protein